MFSRIAPAYDFLNHFLSLGMDIRWRKAATGRIRQNGSVRVLDLCGGTGDFTRQIIRRLPQARVVVADFARPMLVRGQYKLSPLDGIALMECDALSLPFAQQSFDVVVCAFGLRNLADLEQGLQEIQRVLKPGGELVVLEFMGGQRGWTYQLFSLYFRHVLPRLGAWISGDPSAYHYLPGSVSRFITASEFRSLLQRFDLQLQEEKRFFPGVCTLFYGVRT